MHSPPSLLGDEPQRVILRSSRIDAGSPRAIKTHHVACLGGCSSSSLRSRNQEHPLSTTPAHVCKISHYTIISFISYNHRIQFLLAMLRTLAITSLLTGQSLRAIAQRDEVDNSNLAPLKFKEDGTFQISVFSDLHFAEGM